MGYFKYQNTKWKWVLVAVLAATLVTALVVGLVRNNKKNEDNPDPPVTDTFAQEIEVQEPSSLPSEEPETDIPDIEPIEPKSEVPEVEKPDIDVGDMTRNPEPEVVDGSIEYETKE